MSDRQTRSKRQGKLTIAAGKSAMLERVGGRFGLDMPGTRVAS
jgi:hypothetical protein